MNESEHLKTEEFSLPRRRPLLRDTDGSAHDQDDSPVAPPPPVVEDTPDDDIDDARFSDALFERTANWKNRLLAARKRRSSDPEPPRFAGVDDRRIRLSDILNRKKSPKPQVMASAAADSAMAPGVDPNDPFARAVSPLIGPELVALQREVQADEVFVVQLQHARAQAALRQRTGLIIGMLITCGFYYEVGISFFTKTLAHSPIPHLPKSIAQSVIGGELKHDLLPAFALTLGIVVPLLAIRIVADAVHAAWRSAALKDITEFILAFFSFVCAFLVYTTVADAQPYAGLGIIFVWAFIEFVVRILMGRRA